MQRLMTAAPAMTGIRFNNCMFAEPLPLVQWVPPRLSGLFAILLLDSSWGPRPFQPLMFGELGELSPQEYLTCLRAAAGKELYVAVYPLPFSTASHCAIVRNELIRCYDPVCNRTSAAGTLSTELSRKLEALERKNEEHETLLKLTFAAIGKMLDSPMEPRKQRSIGFRPHAKPM